MWTQADKDKLFKTQAGIGCGATILEKEFIDVEVRNMKVLEVGFGACELANRLIKDNEYWGIDLGLGSFAEAENKKISSRGGRLLHLDVSKDRFPLQDDYFDICFILETIEHLESPYHCIEEVKRVLKHSGRLVIVFPRPEANLGYEAGMHAHIYPGFLMKKSFRMFMMQMFFRLKNYAICGSSAYYLYENDKAINMLTPEQMTIDDFAEDDIYGKIKFGAWCGKEPETEDDIKTIGKLI
jgi:ubiquinone/menaquinone biosynthesis C-methylase UbiE